MTSSSDHANRVTTTARSWRWPRIGSWRRIRLDEGYLILIFLLALAGRTALVYFPADVFMGTGLLFDQLGLRIAIGLGMGPTAVLPPLYPEYLGTLYRLYGYSHHAVVLSHALLGSLAAVLAALLVRYVGLGRKYAVLAGIMLALFPQALAQTRHMSPQIVIGFLFLTGTFFWVRTKPYPRGFEIVIAGLTFGLCVLGRAGMIVPVSAVILARGVFQSGSPRTFHLPLSPDEESSAASSPPAWTARDRRRARLRVGLVRGALAVIVLGMAVPWMVRNSRLYDEPVLIDSTWALRLRAATIPGTHEIDYRVPGRTSVVPDHMEVLENRLAFAEIIGFTITEPLTVAGVWLRRVQDVVGFSGWNDAATRDRFPYRGGIYRFAQAVIFGALISLALGWAVLLRGRGDPERVCLAAVLGCVVLAAVGDGPGDARLYALPFLAVLAMRGAWGVLVLSRTRPFARETVEATGPLPIDVEPASKFRVGSWIVLTTAVWIHGFWAL